MRHSWKETDLDPAIESLRSLRIGLTEASRRSLALRCREQVRPGAWSAWLSRLEGLRLPPVRLAAGAMALFVAVFLAILVADRQVPPGAREEGRTEVRLVRVVPAGGGGVTLEWKDGPGRTYTVLKSTDPRNFNGAASYAVRGTRWTDPEPSKGEVVYYRVE